MLYSDYCTIFYAEDLHQVIIYDEITAAALKTVPVRNIAEAVLYMDRWLQFRPSGCICEIL